MKSVIPLLRLLLLLCFSCASLAFEVHTVSQKQPPLFASDTLLEMRLLFEMDSILMDRGTHPHYHPARLMVKQDNRKEKYDLRIKPRGNFRLDPRNCDFPPLKLDFRDCKTKESLFEGQKKLKLVTHCSAEKYVLKEYLAYKLYNLMDSASFKVRLAKIRYVDAMGNHVPDTRYAFLIEDADALAERLGGELIKGDSLRYAPEEAMQQVTARLYLFQYMLGNRDWDIAMKKNIKIVRQKGARPIPIPYDFDFTGWVNAPYTLAVLGPFAKDFDYRKSKKICLPLDVWEKQIQFFYSKKAEILALISGFEMLKKAERTRLIAYVESFYEDIKNPQSVFERFGEDC